MSGAAEYLIGLECGHSWPGDGPATDEEAVAIGQMFVATGDSAACRRCGCQRRIAGPVSRVLDRLGAEP